MMASGAPLPAPCLFLAAFKVIQNLGAADIDTRLEEQLIDGILFAFQEQASLPYSSFFFHERGYNAVARLRQKGRDSVPQMQRPDSSASRLPLALGVYLPEAMEGAFVDTVMCTGG